MTNAQVSETTTADASSLVADPDFELAVQFLELNSMRAEGVLSEEEFATWAADLLPPS
jgi:hypothetical protein